MLRTEALTKIASGGNKKILITYPEAIFEKVILPKTLQQNIISIKQADTIDVNGILEAFVNFGFERTDFVYEPGQFAVRGGILDIYSYGNEHPFRIELFGNEVDSIRIFNPETQKYYSPSSPYPYTHSSPHACTPHQHLHYGFPPPN